MELLLTFSVPRKDTKKLAWGLLNTFGSVEDVLNAGEDKIKKVKGIGPKSALLISIVGEMLTRYNYGDVKEKQSILNQEELYTYITAHLQNKKQETFEALFLDIKLKLITTAVLTEGAVNADNIPFRELVELALRHGAKSVICVHNQPDVEAAPTENDINIAKKIRTVLGALSVTFIDHIIAGGGKLYSLRSKKYLQKPKILL